LSGSKAEIERLRKRVEILETRVDNLMKNAGFDVTKPVSDASEEVMELLLTGRKVEAIKAYRRATGAGCQEVCRIIALMTL